tara:strand:+ start:1920 stop:2312 length:393 start_codon:yes stop_codon:yes gene_type:complete
MATTYKVRYKNHCTPQEQIASGGRYYLDSDCGRKLTGVADTSATLSATGTLASGTAITDTATEVVSAASNADFVYVKNTGSTDVLVTLDDSNYLILLSEDEAFASEIHVNANVKVKTASGTSTIDSFLET